jgi:two-component system, cell cycle sensor histidine kinase and response regulator CckA
MSILVVDDEFESRRLLTALLTAEGYEVRPADSGNLALATTAAHPPNLILLDIHMPGIDGFEVCRRLKESSETRDIPLMFLSATGQMSEKVEGLRLGAVDFVTKPFQREELLARVRTHLELGRLRAHLEQQVAERTAELRESEDRFRTIANAAPVLIWLAGPDKLCTFFNRGWLEFTGRSLEQELGDGWVSGLHPDDSQHSYEIYGSSFDARRPFQMEYRLRRHDGEYRWVLDKGVPRFSSQGVFEGYIGSCIDITDLKQSHDKMLAVQKLESLGVMAASVAHDFNNLLSGIFAETYLALSEMTPEAPGRENVERIGATATFAVEISNMLMASAGAGIDANSNQPVDLSFLIEQTLQFMAVSISKQAEVRTSLAKDLPPLRGNIAEVRQVVINLITNASEALGGKQGCITVTTEKADLDSDFTADDSTNLPSGHYVRLKVSDTGCGMSADTRGKIFDRFFTTKSLGRGLGLAAVHTIVRSHGGAINVVSSPGAGTTFEVLFVCAKPGSSRPK